MKADQEHPHLHAEAKRLWRLIDKAIPTSCPIHLTGENMRRIKLSQPLWQPKTILLQFKKQLAVAYQKNGKNIDSRLGQAEQVLSIFLNLTNRRSAMHKWEFFGLNAFAVSKGLSPSNGK